MWVAPTATQNVDDGQDTDANVGFVPADGMGSSDQSDPSHRSAKVEIGPRRLICNRSKPKSELPTAMQNVADAQEIPVTVALGGPLGPGTVCAAHVAADADAAAPTVNTPQTTADRRTHLPIPVPIPMSRRANPTYNRAR